MYSEEVMKHFAQPKNVGEIKDADGIGEAGNPVCGDMMSFYIKVKDGRLEDVKYKTFGCVAAIAVSSKVSELVKGKTLEEAKALSKKAVAEALGGLPKEKMHCSNLGAEALGKAIADYEARHGGMPLAEQTEKQFEVTLGCCDCSTENPPQAKFCMSCGKELKK
ncbi:MAG: iron-sulfur cluster assembly scaffold protein [Deltaproteobacteria bacterium]|nr:iron-sulfur cluster assembly scaffold protein [Deltaproteobacteria bacterium]MBW1930808.1 iron-sulfur cluster assembly scaffold protein [Deltaproteobacteria bacterium]MBW2024711.1 iron-sulfur cluster assembly scaffold protein [Deltaproteobacteria bacterium]MBW2125484.1 iron-sulfur cluster assembly scaffold protein [Deltaproteobacteria bacterium]